MSVVFSKNLSEVDTVRFLRLYKAEPCLYDISSDEYKNRDLRAAAMKRIAKSLGVDGFGPKEVAIKFKNLRNSYSKELKKVEESQISGMVADDLYVPKVYWFKVMHSFLLPQMYCRRTQSNTHVLKQRSDVDENTGFTVIQNDGNVVNIKEERDCDPIKEERECSPSNSNNKSEAEITENSSEDPTPMFETSRRKKKLCIPPRKDSFPQPSPKQSTVPTAMDRLINEVTEIAAATTANNRDMYDHFGNYVASVLRKAGEHKSILMQHEISNIIFKHMRTVAPASTVTSAASFDSSPEPYGSPS